jgi:hypothetical protein
MTIELTDAHEIAAELYLVPPGQFVAARDELVRRAKAAGNPDLARQLGHLRRPTRSAWLVNLLARHDRTELDRLLAIGRELRQAQTELDTAKLAPLSGLRHRLVADLVDRARQRAAQAGSPASDAVLLEVEGTLHAALVDLAGSFTILSGRLVRPMSHNGFGPLPQVDVPVKNEDDGPGGWQLSVVDAGAWADLGDDLTGGGLRVIPSQSGRPATDHEVEDGDEAEEPLQTGSLYARVRQAEAELAAAEAAHWQREHDLADAEAALEAARDRIDWLDSQRIEARREKVAAEQRLALVRAAQQEAVRAVAEARARLDEAKRR